MRNKLFKSNLCSTMKRLTLLFSLTVAMPLYYVSMAQQVSRWTYDYNDGNVQWYILNQSLTGQISEEANYYPYFPNENAKISGSFSVPQTIIPNNDRNCLFFFFLKDQDVPFVTWNYEGDGDGNAKTHPFSDLNANIFDESCRLRMVFYGWHYSWLGENRISVTIPVPYHMDALDTWGDLTSIQFNPVLFNGASTGSNEQHFDIKDYFKSYFLEGALTCELRTIEDGAYTAGDFTITTSPDMPKNTIYANGNLCFGGQGGWNNKGIRRTYNWGWQYSEINPGTTIGVTFKPKSSGSKSAYLVIKVNGIEIKRILLNATAKDRFYLVTTSASLNTASYDVNLNQFIEPHWFDSDAGTDELVATTKPITYVKRNNSTADVTLSSDGHISARTMGIVYIDVTATSNNEGKYGETLTATALLAINVARGTLIFDNNAGNLNWNNANNWWPHNQGANAIVPDYVNHNVGIAATCTIPSGVANCYNCTVPYWMPIVDPETGQKVVDTETGTKTGDLTINSGGTLYVANELSSTDETLLIKNGGAQDENGILVCRNSSPNANATVEVYVPTYESGKPFWRYMGSPVASGSFANVSYVYQWDNTDDQDNGFGDECWVPASTVSAWKGYAVAKNSSISEQSSVSGKLIFENHAEELTYDKSKVHADQYNNLITNSYTAPIYYNQITEYDFITTEEATFFFFNGGTHTQWWEKSVSLGFNFGSAEGQFTELSLETAQALTGSAYIPSGESFFVKAKYEQEEGQEEGVMVDKKCYFNFRYDMVMPSVNSILNTGYSAPREPEHFNILQIGVEGDSLSDMVFLLENEKCTEKFDNGFDASKMLGVEGTPQIYATNEFGRTAINVDQTITGQYLGFMAGKQGVHYTISFNTDRLEGYESLYLYDTKENKYVDILKGETYRFTGLRSREEKRFLIVGKRDAEEEENTITERTGDDKRIDIFGNQALISGFDGESAEIIISDMSGKTLWNSNTDLGPWFNLPDLPSGVYVMSVDKCQTKFVK